MDLFERWSSSQYSEYLESLSSGIAAGEVASKVLHLASGQTAHAAEYTDVVREMAHLKQKHSQLALEYTYVMKEVVYGKRDAELKDRYERVITALKTLADKIGNYETYITQMQKAWCAEREKLADEVKTYTKELGQQSKPKSVLAVLKRMHRVQNQQRALDEKMDSVAIARLPRVDALAAKGAPLPKKPRPPKALKRTARHEGGSSNDSLSRVKVLVKANFGAKN